MICRSFLIVFLFFGLIFGSFPGVFLCAFGGRRMTGSAFSDGRCVGIASRREFIRMGRRSGGGGAKNRTGAKGSGIFLSSKSMAGVMF